MCQLKFNRRRYHSVADGINVMMNFIEIWRFFQTSVRPLWIMAWLFYARRCYWFCYSRQIFFFRLAFFNRQMIDLHARSIYTIAPVHKCTLQTLQDRVRRPRVQLMPLCVGKIILAKTNQLGGVDRARIVRTCHNKCELLLVATACKCKKTRKVHYVIENSDHGLNKRALK